MIDLKRYSKFRRILKTIKKYNTIVIARHRGADPDALGSQLALKSIILLKYPKKNVLAVGTPSSRFKFMGELDKIETELSYDNTLLIVLDTPDIKRIDIDDFSKYKHIIKIDHHPIIDDYADFEIVDDEASSTCQLILEFIFNNRLSINADISKNLYLGIVSDTGRFMHAYTTKKTFNLVTKLLNKTNIDFTSLYEPLYMRPISEVRFQGYIFENMKVTDNGVGYIEITDDILKKYNVDTATSGNVISEVKCINEILVWIFMTEDKKNDLIRVNIRSRGPIINEVVAKYGGGGHKFASGARLTNWEDAHMLIDDLDKTTLNYKKKTINDLNPVSWTK